MNSEECDFTPKRASGKRSIKRKFTGNRYIKPMKISGAVSNNSASGKKLCMPADDSHSESDGTFKGYTIVDLNLMFGFIETFLSCKTCGGNISLKEEVVCGLSSKISIECKNCSELCKFRNSRMIGSKNNAADINHRFIYSMQAIGKGYASMKVFCGVMDLPAPVSRKSYNTAIKKLSICTKTIAKNSMKLAAEEEVELTESQNIIISGDGTWKTRGHASRVGVCTIIGDKSGKVIDTEVLSSYCKSCEFWKSQKGSTKYSKWKTIHEKDCLNNHSGSAGKMEVVGMLRIFQRSETVHNAKYVSYIGDGDTKTFQAITEASPYGADIPINKIECVGHIQKRMGARLRKIKQSGVKCSDGKTVGGKSRLTDKLIDKFTIYYGNAIREHKNSLPDMRKAIWAIYFHTRSTDSEPLHSFCPPGENSWCGYQNAIANDSVKKFKHKGTIPGCVMDIIKPIFNDLSNPNLLRRCLGGKTQNNNESLNSLIWKFCPKTLGSGRRITEIATDQAVILFNDGNRGRIKIMKEFGINIGSHSTNCFRKLDEQRVITSEMRYLQNTKEMRKLKKMKLKTINEKLLSEEGETYAAGAF